MQNVGKRSIQTDLPPHLFHKLERLAALDDRTIAAISRIALKEFIERRELDG